MPARVKKIDVPKLKVRRGDKVKIISGKDKGQIGYVAKVFPIKQRVIVLQEDPENPDNWLPLNTAVKHFKARYQGQQSARIQKPMPIHVSNVMVVDEEDDDAPSRIGRRKEDGKLVRYFKKSDKTIKDEPDPSIEERKEK
jgi:large subunit ribosomal protein L24